MKNLKSEVDFPTHKLVIRGYKNPSLNKPMVDLETYLLTSKDLENLKKFLVKNKLSPFEYPKPRFKNLESEFEVRDALGGRLTGDHTKDLKRLNKQGKMCSAVLYDQAYQMDQQP